MVFTISVVTVPGAETPIKISAPTSISAKEPLFFSKLVTFENREQAEWYQENILNDQFEEGCADLPEEIFEDEKFPKTVLCIGVDEFCGTYLINENAILAVAKFLSELTNHL